MTRRRWAVVALVAEGRRAVVQATRRALLRALLGTPVAGVNNEFHCGVHNGVVVQGRDISLGESTARPPNSFVPTGDIDNKISGDVVNGPTMQGRDISGPSLGPP